FFNQHAKLAMLFGRYIPVLGIFIPLIAGESRYDQATFQRENIIGTLIWVLGSTLIGYYLGSIPFFQQHFSVLIAGIIVVPAGVYYAVTYLNSLFHHLRR
ncbi:MAG: DedA family protein, partial [Weissella cibaria]